MLIYTVHEPPRPAAALDERADDLVFVKEGLSLGALVFGPLWLAAKRLWLALAGYLAALVVVVTILRLLPGGGPAIGPVLALAAFGLALEANTLWRWSLERRGWQMIGTVTGKSFEECEHRFLASWLVKGGNGGANEGARQVQSGPVPGTTRLPMAAVPPTPVATR